MINQVAIGVCLLAFSGAVQADESLKAEIGKPAPNFTATGIDGKSFELKDKLKSGEKNVVLIFSRANW